ncbi:hypothetical protein H0H93_007624 [Arthromyces matolae]|nr:hypothetical protein H0H93_007624 [Arthromyces matolae]
MVVVFGKEQHCRDTREEMGPGVPIRKIRQQTSFDLLDPIGSLRRIGMKNLSRLASSLHHAKLFPNAEDDKKILNLRPPAPPLALGLILQTLRLDIHKVRPVWDF